MTSRPAHGSDRPRRVWSTRLWLIAALLGAMTIYAGASAVHDTSQRRLALGLITQATAMHMSVLASARLERLALESFAPAGPVAPSRPAAGVGRATIDLLAHRQRQGQACGCRELLPASRFFHYDAATRRLDVVAVDTLARRSAVADTAVIAEIARSEGDAPRGSSNASSRLIADRRLRDSAVVALVQRDERGSTVAVYGTLVHTGETLGALFAGGGSHSPIDSAGLTRLDSLSLEVGTSDGDRLFGALGEGRAKGKVFLGGPLRGLELTIAISPSRVASPLLALHSRGRLWNLGALLAATIVVLALAVGASRRELLLARARSDFIAGVSHDLRMPLAQILIASETLSLRRERTDGERVSLASSIVRETRRLMALVDNVLLFSRSGAVELKPALRPISVTELLTDVTDAVQLAVEDAGQTIEAAAGPPATVIGDRRLVRQALVNLVDNALKYGAAGQRIRMGAEQSGDVVRLYVQDDGPGVPAADRDRIFEPYARLANEVSERTGTGLGLAVVRQIAAACGGRVWLENAPPRGARAVIELKAAPAAAPFPATPEVA
jgi:signal transduction histidine kinase